jgi:hypothetical protein
MFRWLALWFLRSPDPCTHPDAICVKWLDKDGLPMIDFRCPDCGEVRFGHVDADPTTWVESESRP